MSRRFLMGTGGFLVSRSLCATSIRKRTDEHNNTTGHDTEKYPLHSGAFHALVCGENQNKACP